MDFRPLILILLATRLELSQAQDMTTLTLSIHYGDLELYSHQFNADSVLNPYVVKGLRAGHQYTFSARTDQPATYYFWYLGVSQTNYQQSFKHVVSDLGKHRILCRVGNDEMHLDGGIFYEVFAPTVVRLNELAPVAIGASVLFNVDYYTIYSTSNVFDLAVDFKLLKDSENEEKLVNTKIPLNCVKKSVTYEGNKYYFHCIASYRWSFSDSGLYSVSVEVKQEEQSATTSVDVCVTSDPTCPPPLLRIEGSTSTKNSMEPQVVYRVSEAIRLFGEIVRSTCLDTSTPGGTRFSFSWNVIAANAFLQIAAPLNPQNLKEVEKVELPHEIKTEEVNNLHLPATTLPPGSYVVVFSGTESPFCGDRPVFTHSSLKLEIVRKELRAVIAGGSFREWRQSSRGVALELDSSPSLSGVSDSNDVFVTWFCTIFYRTDGFTEKSKPCFGSNSKITDQEEFVTFTESNSVISLRGEQFPERQDEYTFTVVLQRRSDNETSKYKQVVKRVWPMSLSLPLVQLSITCLSNCREQAVKGKPVTLQANCTGCDVIGYDLEHRWKVTGPGKAKPTISVLPDSSNFSNFELTTNDLEKPGTYDVEVEVAINNQIASTSRYSIEVARGPRPGICQVWPRTGVALETHFRMECLNFRDDEKPMAFAVEASSEDPRKNREDGSVLLHRGTSNIIEDILLPAGSAEFGNRLNLRITATNRRGDSTVSSYYLVVKQPELDNFESSMEKYVLGEHSQMRHLAKSGNIDALISLATSVLAVVEQQTTEEQGPQAEVVSSTVIQIASRLAEVKVASLENAYQVASTLEGATRVIQQQKSPPMQNHWMRFVTDTLNIVNSTSSFVAATADPKSLKVIELGLTSLAHLMTSSGAERSAQEASAVLAMHESLLENLVTLAGNKIFKLGQIETINIVRVAPSTDRFEVGVGDRHGGVAIMAELVKGVAAAAVSTLYYNPLPAFGPDDASAAFPSPILPVISLSLFGSNRNDDSGDGGNNLSGRSKRNSGYNNYSRSSSYEDTLVENDNNLRPSAQGNYNNSGRIKATSRNQKLIDVFVPVRESADGADALSSHRVGTATLSPQCEANRSSDSQCNPPTTADVTIKLDEEETYPDPNQVVGFLVFLPKHRCRVPGSTCLKVSFLKAAHKDSIYCTTSGTCAPGQAPRLLADLPLAVNEDSDSGAQPHEWAIPVPRSLLDEMADPPEIDARKPAEFRISLVIENTQPDPLEGRREAGDADGFQEVDINFVRPFCYAWNREGEFWDSSACQDGRLVRNGMIHCKCKVDPDQFRTDTKVAMLFGVKLLVLPNRIKVKDLLEILQELSTSYYVILCVFLCWFVFAPAFRWANKQDKLNECCVGVHIPADSDAANDRFLYEVVIATGFIHNSGTTANVTLSLGGDHGAWSECHVISDLASNLLQRGSVDTFLIGSPKSLGRVSTVRLWHDNTGTSPSWRIERVAVYDLQSGESPSLFVATVWLSLDIIPFQCHAEFRESTSEELASFRVKWRMSLAYQVQNNNVWTSPFTRIPSSTFTTQQRVACCMVAIFSCLLASIMFFDASDGDSTDGEGDPGFKVAVGFVSIDITPIIAATEAAILLAPINYTVSYIFRNLRPPAELAVEAAASSENADNFTDITEQSQVSNSELQEATSLVFFTNDMTSSLQEVNRPTEDDPDRYSSGDGRSLVSSGELGAVASSPNYDDVNDDTLECQSIYEQEARESGYVPTSCRSLAWTIVLLHVLVCSCLTVLYGLQYGNSKFMQWLVAFLLSIVQNLIVVTPVCILATSALVALARCKGHDLGQWRGYGGQRRREEALLRWRTLKRHQRSFQKAEKLEMSAREREVCARPWCYAKPDFKRLNKAGRLTVAIGKVRRFWIETFTWLLIAALATSLLLLQRDERTIGLNNAVRDSFGESFAELRHRGEVLAFVDETIVPLVFADDGWEPTFVLLGPVRLKQARLKPIPCTGLVRRGACKKDDTQLDSLADYSTEDYTLFWQNGSSFDGDSELKSPWQYRDMDELHRTRFVAGNPLLRPFYPRGGYVMDLGYSADAARQQLNGLESAMWIDAQTAVVFVEFSIFTAHLKAVTSVTLAVEMLAVGGLHLHAEVNTYRPPYVYSLRDFAVVSMQALHLIVNGALLVDAFAQCRAERWRRDRVFRILVGFWNFLALLTIVLSLAAYATYLAFLKSSAAAGQLYRKDRGRFVPFATPAQHANSYAMLLTAAAFFSELRVLKALRGNHLVSVMLDTLVKARHELLSVTIMTLITTAAFAHSGYAAFHAAREPFKSLHFSSLSLISLSVGMDVSHPPGGVVQNVGWVLYFAVFMTLSIVLFANLYAAVVDEAYSKVREEAAASDWYPLERLAFWWLHDRIFAALGLASSRLPQTEEAMSPKKSAPIEKEKVKRERERERESEREEKKEKEEEKICASRGQIVT